MEIVMKSIGRFLIIPLLGISVSLHGQAGYKAVQEAFETSYALETKADYANAIAALKSVYDESSYEINIRLGWLTYLSGLFTESSAYYQKCIKLKPLAIEAKLGYVLPVSAIGNWDQVMAQYEEILKIDPQNSLVNYRVGMIYYGRSEYALAEKYFEKVVNLFPFDYDSNIIYAWTEYKLGKLREAQVLFNKVLMMRPRDDSATIGLSLIK